MPPKEEKATEEVVEDDTEAEMAAFAARARAAGPMPQEIAAQAAEEEPVSATGGLPVLPLGHWDYLIRRYKPKKESVDYPRRFLFDPETGRKVEIFKFPVDGDEGWTRDTSVEV